MVLQQSIYHLLWATVIIILVCMTISSTLNRIGERVMETLAVEKMNSPLPLKRWA